LRHVQRTETMFGVARLLPAGLFYVNLRGQYERGRGRKEVLEGVRTARANAYRHSGRFDSKMLRQLDTRPDASCGEQFNYRLNQDGQLNTNSRDAIESDKFVQLLDGVEKALMKMGQEIFAGVTRIDPYQKGAARA